MIVRESEIMSHACTYVMSMYIFRLFETCESHMWTSFVARSQFIRAYPLLPGILIPKNYDVLCASLH